MIPDSGNKDVYIRFFDDNIQNAVVNIKWVFKSGEAYRVNICTPAYYTGRQYKTKDFPSTSGNRLWLIRKTSEFVAIYCDGEEIAKVVYDEVDESEFPECKKMKDHSYKFVMISNQDSATDSFLNPNGRYNNTIQGAL